MSNNIFLLKLDIEGMEPDVLRSIASPDAKTTVKFVTFEYAGNAWREKLEGTWTIERVKGSEC
eukprot:5333650-Amphidinium_carterae.1